MIPSLDGMKILMSVFFCLLCCILCASDQTIATLTSPRVVLVFVLMFWVRCECFICMRIDAMCCAVKTMCDAVGPNATAKEPCRTAVSLSEHHALLCEIKSLNQTVAHLSDQQALLLEIRNGVLKSMRCSRDVFDRMNSSSSQDSSPSCSRDVKKHIEMARRHFRRSSASESCISFPGDVVD